MTVTNPYYWDLAGTPLETYAWNLKTRGGSLRGTPNPRGDNQPVPYRHGKRFLPKFRDSRILQFNMWILGSNDDGSVPVGTTKLDTFNANYEALADLFDFDGQRVLTKRWLEGITPRSATALVEYAGGLEPSMRGQYLADFSPSLLLADPWFYEAPVTIAIDGGAKIIRGDRPTDFMTITFTGGTNPRLTIGTRWIQYTGVVGGSPVTIDVNERSAARAGLYVNGAISRDMFDPNWLELPVGSVTPVLTGGGSCSVTYQARFR